MAPTVAVIAGPDHGSEQAVKEGPLTIGRGTDNVLVITDALVSRHHCEIATENGAYVLRDLDTRNGTFVNGLPIKQKEIQHRDVIEIGRSALLFKCRADEGRLSPPVEFAHTDASPDWTITVPLRQLSSVLAADSVGRMVRDLNALFKISTAVSAVQDVSSLEQTVLKLLMEVVPADRAAILLSEYGLPDPAAAFVWNRKTGRSDKLQIDTAVLKGVLELRLAAISNDASGAGSILCAPLIAADTVLGAIYLVTSRETFQDDHLNFVIGVSGIASVALNNALTIRGLRTDNERLQRELQLDRKLVGDSPRMRQVFEFIQKAARVTSTVLLRGESGTGKELVARAIHGNSARSTNSFVAINCAALPETLLESELFGHEKGAFTGADRERKGKFEIANGGTIFLDEIGEMSSVLQAKLLRVLQEREFERIGGSRTIKVDLRLIAATNAELEEAIEQGRFRGDLYYRLNVLSLTLPPLRERKEDVPLLVAYFIAKHAGATRAVKGITPQARSLLLNYDWPGNVRELENVVERAMVMGCTDYIQPEDLPEYILETQQMLAPTSSGYHQLVNDFKRRQISNALKDAGDNITEAARKLEIHPNYLHRLIRNLSVRRGRTS